MTGKKKGIMILAAAMIVLAVLVIAVPLFTRKEGSLDSDPTAMRSRPRAGYGRIAPGVSEQAAMTWQNAQYISMGQYAVVQANYNRQQAGLEPLEWSDDLASCAIIRASETTRYFAHTRPDGTDWYTLSPDLMYGENIAFGYPTPEAVVQGWMNSPVHRANIMNPGYRTCGVGAYMAQNGQIYWVQEFGY